MVLPETVPVRFTEEEADYVSMRPIVQQAFTLDELVGMVLTATGKHPQRVREILRAGTMVYNMYRYWWERLDVPPEALAKILARFPDPDPARPFRAEECVGVVLEIGGRPPGLAVTTIEIGRDVASRRRLFRSQSLWDCLMDLTRASHGSRPVYQDYSYARRADLFVLSLTLEQAAALAQDATRLAGRKLRAQTIHLPETTRVIFICPRPR